MASGINLYIVAARSHFGVIL